MKIYFYKLTVDDGGAPCVQDETLSLAICKPFIRSTAEPGDLIFGFAAASLRRNQPLLYVARVTRKVPGSLYYTSSEFRRRPDRIYTRRGGKFMWRSGARYHGPQHVERDLGRSPVYRRSHVLLSTDFRYLGRSGTDEYRVLFPRVAKAVDALRQGHRVWHSNELRRDLLTMKERAWSGDPVIGKPISAPRPDACHRGRTCAVVD